MAKIVSGITTSQEQATQLYQHNPSVESAGEMQCWVIIQKRKTFQLHVLNVPKSRTDAMVIHDLREIYDSVKHTRHWWHSEGKVAEAVVSPFCIGDPELQDYPRDVLVVRSKLRPDLTDAFRTPNVLRGTTNFIHLNGQFDIQSKLIRGNFDNLAILILNDINKYTLAWVLSAMVLAAIIVGIVVGILVDGSFGVATSTGIIAVFALIQGSIFKMCY